MRKVFLFANILLTPTLALAGSIHGVVNDDSGALPDADVIIYKQSDTTRVLNTDMTTIDGKFQFNNLPNGHYMIKVEYMGYKTRRLNVSLSSAKPDIRSMRINMKDDASMLQGVEVKGQRTSLHVDADKKTFLVNASAVVEGVSVSDLLREVPSVDVDVEGNVSLRSNENVEIYINGKPAGFGEGNSAEILEQLPANSIEKVEVITNPSSKYNAEGEAGIINIVLKDDHAKGYYGSVNAGLSVPIDGHITGSLGASITYTNNNWTLTGAAGWQGRGNEGSIDRYRRNYRGGDTTYTQSNAIMNRDMNSEFLRLGASYKINKSNSISWTGLGSLAQRDFKTDYRYTYGDISNGFSTINKYNTNYTTTDGDRKILNTSLDYTHDFEREGENLRLAVSANSSKNDNENNYSLTELDSLRQAIAGTRSFEVENRKTNTSNYSAQADYTLPLGKTSKIELGAKAEWRNDQTKTDTVKFFEGENHLLGNYKENSYLYDANKAASVNNDFEMQQNIYAAYVSFSSTINKRFKYNVGLRGELTDMSWKQNITNDKSSKNPYFHLFPSAFLSYTISDKDEIQLNYTRRLTRPRMFSINPYVNTSDSLNLRYGNPDLDPELTHSIELNYVKNVDGDLYTASIYYKLTNDIVSRYTWVDGQISNTTFGNMSKCQQEGLELIAKNHIKFLTLTTNINLYYYDLEGGLFDINVVNRNGHIEKKEVYLNDNSSFSWTGKVSADLKLPLDIAGQITANYNSPRANAQGRRHHNFTMNAGLKRSFLKRKLSASLNVRDVFNTFRFKSDTHDEYFDQENDMKFFGTTFNLGLSYSFGNMGNSKKKRDGGSDEVEDFEFGGE